MKPYGLLPTHAFTNWTKLNAYLHVRAHSAVAYRFHSDQDIEGRNSLHQYIF